MRRLLTRTATGICLAGIGLAIAYALTPGRGALELQVCALVVGAIVVLAAVLAVQDAFPPAGTSALADALKRRREPDPQRPPGLVATERLAVLAVATAFDLHYRLRPILREIAAQRLADNRGLRLDGGGPKVEAALGEELWELVRPDRAGPESRFGPGTRPEALRRAIEGLESIT
ncbi:MAG TPA: hypothetical protein VEG40_03735 [Gaiellaceae bacterium]|nr:hypothetical protein [Gaiellaceae bacterium]